MVCVEFSNLCINCMLKFVAVQVNKSQVDSVYVLDVYAVYPEGLISIIQ